MRVLSKGQYWAVILIGFIFLGINGFLVVKLVNGEVEFDRSCPLPLEEINGCECVYDPIFRTLRYCTCWPGTSPNYSDLLTPRDKLLAINLTKLNSLVNDTNGTG